MYFNRMKFNRLTVIYAEAHLKAESSVFAAVHNSLEAAAHMESKGNLEAVPGKIAYVSAEITGASYIAAKVHAPVYVASEIKSDSTFIAKSYKVMYPAADIVASAHLSGKLTVDALIYTEIHANSSFYAHASKTMAVTVLFGGKNLFKPAANVLRSLKISFSGTAHFAAVARVAAVETIYFNNLTFKPGDTIEIDLCNQYAEMNGSNLMDKWSGDFFKLYPGDNILIWRDNVAERNIETKIRYQNKYL